MKAVADEYAANLTKGGRPLSYALRENMNAARIGDVEKVGTPQRLPGLNLPCQAGPELFDEPEELLLRYLDSHRRKRGGSLAPGTINGGHRVQRSGCRRAARGPLYSSIAHWELRS